MCVLSCITIYPKNIESYYQEIGRAGRDGLPSRTVLFYSYADVMQHRRMLDEEESKVKAVKTAKLERLQQYAEANMCRRRILLNYFNEDLQQNCGNCDVCHNPRQTFDGTVIAQKVFSAIWRMKEEAALYTVVDVLRGLRTHRVISRAFDKIKTYGQGREYKPQEWMQYITQLVNMGYMTVAYDQHSFLKLTEKCKKVLFEGEKVDMVRAQKFEKEVAPIKKKTKKELLTDELFETLRLLRKKMADEQGVPPYVIFNDETLRAMAAERPVKEEEMVNISGVGLRKMAFYGEAFISEILKFLATKGQKLKGATYFATYYHYLQQLNPSEIAKTRELTPTTIYSHLAWLHQNDYTIDIPSILSDSELLRISKAMDKLGKSVGVKEVHDYLEGKMGYGKIRLGLLHLQG